MNLKKALSPLKKKLQTQSKTYQTIRRVYPHLEDLSDEEILSYYHVPNLQALHEHITYLQTLLKNKHANYHAELEKMQGCFCQDAKGDFKYLYPTKKEAEAQMLHIRKTKHILLTIYPCPYHMGWHLSRI